MRRTAKSPRYAPASSSWLQLWQGSWRAQQYAGSGCWLGIKKQNMSAKTLPKSQPDPVGEQNRLSDCGRMKMPRQSRNVRHTNTLSSRKPGIYLITRFFNFFLTVWLKNKNSTARLPLSLRCDPLQIQYLHSVTIHFPLTVCRGVHQHQCLLPQRLDVLQHTWKLQRRFGGLECRDAEGAAAGSSSNQN